MQLESGICVISALCLLIATTVISKEINLPDELYVDDSDMSEYDQYINMAEGFLNGREQGVKQPQQDVEWDVLVFTQQWPLTACYQWREEDKDHTCQLPKKKNIWTIHGIWPTKIGKYGPEFCNKSAKFDVHQLEPIRNDLDIFWPTIHGPPDDEDDYLWKHEWLKHGTCVSHLDNLNNEAKYFGQGLQWRDAYTLSRILSDSGITPDSSNTVIALHNAVVKVLGKNPSIHCYHDNKTDISYLMEIRVCFNKSLEIVDCDGVRLGDTVTVNYPGGTVNTNCHISLPVHYPDVVPPIPEKSKPWRFPIVNFYKLVQFLTWSTL